MQAPYGEAVATRPTLAHTTPVPRVAHDMSDVLVGHWQGNAAKGVRKELVGVRERDRIIVEDRNGRGPQVIQKVPR